MIIMELAFLLMVLGILYAMWRIYEPDVRYNEYITAYRIGKLVQHAKDKNVELIFPTQRKVKATVLEIDEAFEADIGEKKEKEKGKK